MTEHALQTALGFESPQDIYLRVYRALRPGPAAPGFDVRFEPFANANSSIRNKGHRIEVRMSDVLESAPASIVEALAFILLSKLYRHRIPAEYNHRYRRYLNRKDIRQRIQELRQERGRKLITGPSGSAYDLEKIFDDLNFRYFFGLMAKPNIGWSLRASRMTLGHYDPSHNTIVLSKLLDRHQVPAVVVEYVMFHEMLHIRHPVEHAGSRRCVHTRDFKEAEKQFAGLKEAKGWLKHM